MGVVLYESYPIFVLLGLDLSSHFYVGWVVDCPNIEIRVSWKVDCYLCGVIKFNVLGVRLK